MLATGTSIPDTLSSVMVARQGEGDMAVANAIGSNVFNIFLGIGLPMFITQIVWKEPYITTDRGQVAASGMMLTLITLIMYLSLYWNGWILTKRLSAILMTLFFLYIVFSILFENGTIGFLDAIGLPKEAVKGGSNGVCP